MRQTAMTFVNRTSRTSDKSNVRLRARTQAPGLSEAYLWGKGELEDMLYQPKNDDSSSHFSESPDAFANAH